MEALTGARALRRIDKKEHVNSEFMKYFQRLLASAKASPRTTAAGLTGSIASITAAIHNSILFSTPEWWTALFVSIGLLFAGDAKA